MTVAPISDAEIAPQSLSKWLRRACGYENITDEVRRFQSGATNGLVLDAADSLDAKDAELSRLRADLAAMTKLALSYDEDNDKFRDENSRLRAAQAGGVAGWQLVPHRPTPEMWTRAYLTDYIGSDGLPVKITARLAEQVYCVMLAASPLQSVAQPMGEELISALKPFADAAEYAEDDEGDDYCLSGSSARHKLTLGHLRKARAVLSALSAGGSDDDQCSQMLWKWFDERGAVTRTEARDGLTAEDFKTMLDEHEIALTTPPPSTIRGQAIEECARIFDLRAVGEEIEAEIHKADTERAARYKKRAEAWRKDAAQIRSLSLPMA